MHVVSTLREQGSAPTACVLYTGTRNEATQGHPSWTWQEQRRLLETRNSRQGSRQATRLKLKLLKQIDISAACNAADSKCFDFSEQTVSPDVDPGEPGDGNEDDDDDDDDEPPISRKSVGGLRRNRDESSGPSRPTKRGKASSGGDGGGGGGDDDDPGSDDDGGDDDDPEDNTPEPEPKAKPKAGSRKVSLKSTQESRNLLAKADTKLGEIVSSILINKDFTLKNTNRVARKLTKIKLSRHVKLVTTDKSEVLLESKLAGPPLPGRAIRPLTCKRSGHNTESWKFTFSGGVVAIEVSHTMLPPDAPKSDLQTMHTELTRIYNAWPWPIDKVAPNVRRQWVLVALSRVFARPLQIDQVTNSGSYTYQTQVHYIDATTGLHQRQGVAATAADTSMALVTVPPLRPINVIKTKDKTVRLRKPESPFYIAAPPATATKGKGAGSSTWAQRRAEDAVYWISTQLQGLVATPARMKELYTEYRKQIGLLKRSVETGMYGGEADLYTVRYNRNRLTSTLYPTKKIFDDLGLKKSDLVLGLDVYSLNATRSTPVMDTIVQLFSTGMDIRHIWIEAAKAADLVNIDIGDGVPPSSSCDCDNTQTTSEWHACEGCATPTLCHTRTFDSMRRLVCVLCKQRDQLYLERVAGQSLAGRLAYSSLWRNFRLECTARGFDASEKKYKSIFDAAWAEVRAQLPGDGKVEDLSDEQLTVYVDRWSDQHLDIGEERAPLGSNPSRRRYVPHGITIDAIHRQGAPTYSSLKHSEGNLRVTSNACQMAKGQFNAGVLHEIGAFLRLDPDKQASDEARQELIEKMVAMAVVGLKRPYIMQTAASARAKFNKFHSESVAGAPTPGEHGPWEEKSQRFVSRKVPDYDPDGNNVWDEETWDATQQCARSMEKLFKVKLHTLDDGTLWIGTDYSNPAGLHRNGISILCEERLARLRTRCNKKWETTDNAVKIYLEILFQHCCSLTEVPALQSYRRKYGDRFGLPLVLWLWSPLRFSVGHRHHGFEMATGWVSEIPINVKERIDNDELNNMLIESWFVNAAKLDMAEEYYPHLDTILRSAEITDKTIYNPGVDPTSIMVTPLSTNEPEIPEDDFLGAEFNNVEDIEGDITDDTKPGKPATPAAGDDDTEEADTGSAVVGEDTEMTGDPDEYSSVGGGNEELQEQASVAWQAVVNHERLKEFMAIDQGLRTLLAKIQNIADGAGDQAAMDAAVGGLYENYINQA